MGVFDRTKLFGFGDRPAVRYTHLKDDDSGAIEMSEPHESLAVQ